MRRHLERWARSIGVAALGAALAVALWQLLRPVRGAIPATEALPALTAERADSGIAVARALREQIVRHVMTSDVGVDAAWPRVAVHVQSIPAPAVRAVLGAAVASGIPLRWENETGVHSLSLDAAAATTPSSATLLHASVTGAPPPSRAPSRRDAVSRSALVARDAGGLLDSIALSPNGGMTTLRLRAAAPVGALYADVWRGGQRVARATAPIPPAAGLRRVLLYAQPGWESKFIIAALEESGWLVDGRLRLSPRAVTVIGAPAAPDTGRYAAAVVVDSGVADVRALRRFVSQGGGLIVAGDGLRDVALGDLRVGRVGVDRPAVAGALLTDTPRRGLAAWYLRGDPDVVALDGEGERPVVLVARRGVGRLLASGYRGTWRWRMEGRDDAADAHRQWWSQLVGAVAWAPAVADSLTVSDGWPGDAAPMADLVARVGLPSGEAMATPRATSDVLPPLWLLFVIAAIALVLEWASRRTRGAP